MDTAHIEKRIGVRAPSDKIWEVIIDLPGWDRWNPHETAVQGVIAFGGALSLTESLPGVGERRVAAAVGDWRPYSRLVWSEKRGWMFGMTRYFDIEELAPGSCVVTTGALFTGLRGEMFHDKHRRAIRAAYEAMLEQLRLTVEG